MEFCLNSLTKNWKKIAKIPIFQKDPFFAIKGCFSQMFVLQKRFIFARGLNWDQSCLWKTPPSHFLLFSPLACPYFFFNLSPDFLRVREGPCKNLYVFGEDWQRNQVPKLTTFYRIFHPCHQLCHSALILDYPLGILDYPHWVDQSEAASHTMRHVLSLPLILFPFAVDHWKRGSMINPSCVDNLPCPCDRTSSITGHTKHCRTQFTMPPTIVSAHCRTQLWVPNAAHNCERTMLQTIERVTAHNGAHNWKHTCGNFWQLVSTVGNFWQLLATFSNFWQLVATFCNFFVIFLQLFGIFFHLVATCCNLWQLLAILSLSHSLSPYFFNFLSLY